MLQLCFACAYLKGFCSQKLKYKLRAPHMGIEGRYWHCLAEYVPTKVTFLMSVYELFQEMKPK
jgi:hypothetical protein